MHSLCIVKLTFANIQFSWDESLNEKCLDLTDHHFRKNISNTISNSIEKLIIIPYRKIHSVKLRNFVDDLKSKRSITQGSIIKRLRPSVKWSIHVIFDYTLMDLQIESGQLKLIWINGCTSSTPLFWSYTLLKSLAEVYNQGCRI